jgi:hypothetical protein
MSLSNYTIIARGWVRSLPWPMKAAVVAFMAAGVAAGIAIGAKVGAMPGPP